MGIQKVVRVGFLKGFDGPSRYQNCINWLSFLRSLLELGKINICFL